MAYNAGDAFLQIIPSFDNVAKAIDAEATKWGVTAGKAFSSSFNDTVNKGTNGAQLGPSDSDSAKQGDSKAAKFADAFKARVTAALKNLPDITVDANTSDADAKIAELRQRLTELRDANIGVDIDEATALAAIDDIKAQLDRLAAESPDIRVQADTAAASAELDRLRAQIDEIANDSPDVDVKADTSEADAKLAATKAAADDLAGSSPSIDVDVDAGPALAAIGAIKTALLGLSAGALITPLVGGLAAMLGPLAAVGTGIAGIAAVGVPAFSAVTKAEQAQSAAATAGGKSASDAAAQIEQAELSLADTERRIANDKITSAEQVKNAEQAVTDAETAGARSVASADASVTSAEQNLADAQKASLAAQQALTDAREQGARSLQDSAFAAQDAALNLQQDQLAVTEAQQNLDAVNASSTSTDLQKQEAALALQQAQQALAEQTVTLQRATEDNNKAQAAGVDGTSQVVSAQNAITQAQTQQTAAAKALTAAQQADAQAKVDANEKIAQAQQSLADALRAQQQQQAQDASDLTRANLALAQAQQANAGGASAYGAALAALTPAELQLKNALDDLKTKYTAFQTALDPTVIPLFTGGLGILADLMKPLEPLITAVAKAISSVETSIDNAIQGPGFAKFIGTLTQLAGPSVASIADILGNLGGAISGLIEAFAPLSSVVFGGLSSLTKDLKDATSGPGITAFVTTLEELAPTLISAFHDVGGLVGSLFSELAPLAQPVLAVVGSLATALTGIVKGVGPSLTALFNTLGPAVTTIVKALGPAITTFIQALAPALASLTPALTTLGSAISRGIVALAPVLQPIATLISAIVTAAAPLIPVLAQLISDLLPPLATLFTDLFTALQPVTSQLAEALGPVLPVLAQAFSGLITALAPLLPTLAQLLIDLLPLLLPLANLIAAVLKLATDLLPIFIPLLKAISPILQVLVLVLSDVVTGLTNVINWITDAITWFKQIGDTASTVAHAIGTAWDALWAGLKSGWNDISQFFAGVWKDFASSASKAWDTIASGIKTAFGAVTGFVKGIWHDVETVFVGAVNWVVDHILNPIIGLLNDVLSPFGVSIGKVADISTSVQSANAVGGVLPGYTPGTDGISLPVHLFSGGEGILVPEATRALGGKRGIDAINARYSNRIGQKFATGGTVGAPTPAAPFPGATLPVDTQAEANDLFAQYINDFLNSALSKSSIGSEISGAVSGVVGAIRAGAADVAIAGLDSAEAPIKALLGAAPSSLAGKMANGFFSKINTEVDSFIRGQAAKASPDSSKDEHQVYIETALGLAGHDNNPFNVTAVDIIVSNESGWNPDAINLTDSNAAAGHPSQGLMQTIPGTFEEYRLSSLPDDIYDPLANLVAGIRYAFADYGSLGNVPGVKALANGQPYVGYDSGGYLPPGLSTVFNATGRPEPVFTTDQWAQIRAGGIGSPADSAALQRIAANSDHLPAVSAAAVTALSEVNGLGNVLVGATS